MYSVNSPKSTFKYKHNLHKNFKSHRVCDAAIQFFADNAMPSDRFKFTLDRVGREEFYKKIKEAYNG